MADITIVALLLLLVAVMTVLMAQDLAAGIGALLVPVVRWGQRVFFGIDLPRSGPEILVGKRALVHSDFALSRDSGVHEGYVVLNGELWRARAVSQAQPFCGGEAVTVSGREGLLLKVVPCEEPW